MRGRCVLSNAQEFPEPEKAQGDGSDIVQVFLSPLSSSTIISCCSIDIDYRSSLYCDFLNNEIGSFLP